MEKLLEHLEKLNQKYKKYKIIDEISGTDTLTESWLVQFGAAIEMIIQRLFGWSTGQVLVRGTRREVSDFANVMGKQKKYMEKAKELGLDDPKIVKDKIKFEKAIKAFEKSTGIKFPFRPK